MKELCKNCYGNELRLAGYLCPCSCHPQSPAPKENMTHTPTPAWNFEKELDKTFDAWKVGNGARNDIKAVMATERDMPNHSTPTDIEAYINFFNEKFVNLMTMYIVPEPPARFKDVKKDIESFLRHALTEYGDARAKKAIEDCLATVENTNRVAKLEPPMLNAWNIAYGAAKEDITEALHSLLPDNNKKQ